MAYGLGLLVKCEHIFVGVYNTREHLHPPNRAFTHGEHHQNDDRARLQTADRDTLSKERLY